MISVIMGVHAVDAYLNASIQSILDQTERNLELIIIANGAQHAQVAGYIKNQFSHDKRIHIIQSKIGQLSYALNLGLDHARFDYIARMDSDDIALPERLAKQLNHLLEFELDMVGCDLTLIDSKGKELGEQCYPKGSNIARYLPFKNPFAHNTILAKKQLFIEARGYNAGFNTEDYDLWLRLGRNIVRWDNMPEKLVLYRIHDAASKGQLLGYAESAAYSLREFFLKKNPNRLFAIFVQIGKAILKPNKK
ncbi:glycosyltransferase [Alcaligenes sp. PF14]|uniref:glycosyltransferase n=1 Tax=Alcaligenes sp. PF14 TaxID=3120297 RepID=UPI00301B2505